MSRYFQAAVLAPLLLVGGCGSDAPPELRLRPMGVGEQALFVADSHLWRHDQLRVCFSFQGFDTEKAWVREAVLHSWGSVLPLTFTGWESCPRGDRGPRPNIVVSIDDRASLGPHTEGLGQVNDLAHVVLNFTFREWGRSWPVHAGGRQRAIEAIALHEFGHVLGFAHEHNRADTNRATCTEAPQGGDGTLVLTPWDPASIMNYCARGARLSGPDVIAAQALYGIPADLYLDVDFYAQLNPDVVAVMRTRPLIADHFKKDGARERRWSAPWFDVGWYRQKYDVTLAHRIASTGELEWDAVRSFAGEGMAEGRSGSELWDPIYYLRANPDVAAWAGPGNYAAALHHWREHGIDEGRAGSPWFWSRAYLRRYADVAAASPEPNDDRAAIAHYVRFGRFEGRHGGH